MCFDVFIDLWGEMKRTPLQYNFHEMVNLDLM